MTLKNEMLRVAITTSLVAAIVFAETAFSAGYIYADAEVVEFESVAFTYTPSPLRIKQAKNLGNRSKSKSNPAFC